MELRTYIEPVREPPRNFSNYIEEVAEGLSELYGAGAAADYRAKAPSVIEGSLGHPAVQLWGAFTTRSAIESHEPAALLMAATRAGVAQISFIHVLRPYEGTGLEAELVKRAVSGLRVREVSGIVSESVSMCRLNLDGAYEELGFCKVERQLMMAPLTTGALARPALLQSVSWSPADFSETACVIAEAYQRHPERLLHAEVRTPREAEVFVRCAAEAGFGPARAAYGRILRRDGRITGAAIGCEASPEVGFVLQVAVRPTYQRKGLGTILVKELAQVFREAGMARVALGVTVTNPARNLYERLGFRKIKSVNAYVWWKSRGTDAHDTDVHDEARMVPKQKSERPI